MRSFIASIILIAALPGTAEAGDFTNGLQLNGLQLNGFTLNGLQLNGFNANQFSLNGSNRGVITFNGLTFDENQSGKQPAPSKPGRLLKSLADGPLK